MKRNTVVFITIISTFFVLSCSKKGPASPESAHGAVEKQVPMAMSAGQIGQKAAALEGLTFVKGKPVTIQEGKVYVVEFWATWCGPCRVTIPHLTEVQKQFKDKGVTVIGISTDVGDDLIRTNDDLDRVKAFVAEQGDKMDYTVAWDAKGKVDAGYMTAFGQSGIPTAFIVDAKGNVAWFGHPLDGLDEVLGQVVAGTFDAAAYGKAKADAEAAEQRIYDLYVKYVTAIRNGDPIEQTRPTAEKLIEIGHAEALYSMALQILMQEDKSGRDIQSALKAAEKANTLTNGDNPMVLNTYAMALFENGKVAEATAVQEKAIGLADDNAELKALLKKRMESFNTPSTTPKTPETPESAK